MHIDLPERLYYSIGEVAEAFGVNTSLIRFWEKEFEILKPKKNAKGNRKFTPQDIKNLELIYHLVKERGFTLDQDDRIRGYVIGEIHRPAVELPRVHLDALVDRLAREHQADELARLSGQAG